MPNQARPQVVHASVHARPTSPIASREISLYGQQRTVCDVTADEVRRPLHVSFEELADRLMAQPRLFFEPDGSFVWVGGEETGGWQIDGQLNDSAQGLMSVEVKISGHPTHLPALWQLCGAPDDPLLIQIVPLGVYLEPSVFDGLFR